MIFYEAPHKLPATLKDLAATFGPERPISLCRELSKLHEEIRRTTLGEAADYYDQNPPRGVCAGSPGSGTCPGRGGHPGGRFGAECAPCGRRSLLRDAVKQAAKELSLSRNELYDMAVNDK